MSVFGKIAGFFSGAVNGLVELAEKVWNAIHTVWSFLTSVATILSGAWDWMVNGVEWFTKTVTDWAAAVYTTAWHTLTNVIPKAAEWAFHTAAKWAAAALHTVEHFLRGLIHTLRTWVEHEVSGIYHFFRNLIGSVVKWVTGPIRWVLSVGRHIANLVLHPKALVEWFIGALIEPLVMWFLRSGANVLIWLLRLAVRDSSEVAHLIEELLEKVV